MNTDLEVTLEILIPAPKTQVWHFFMNAEKMKTWLGADEFVIDMTDGGKIEIPLSFRDQEYLIIGEFSILLFEERYAFVWREQDQFGDEWFNCTTVIFDIEEKDGSTLVRFEHNGFKYLPAETRDGIYQRYLEFWGKSGIFKRLNALILAE